MKAWQRLGVLTAVLVVLSACGYKPLYPSAKQNVSNVHVASVTMREVELKPGSRRAAQLLAQSLKRHYYGDSYAPYQLSIRLTERTSELSVSRAATTTRSSVSMSGDMVITRDGEEVHRSGLSVFVPYNVEDSPFGTEAGREQARESAVREIETTIVNRIGIILHKNEREDN